MLNKSLPCYSLFYEKLGNWEGLWQQGSRLKNPKSLIIAGFQHPLSHISPKRTPLLVFQPQAVYKCYCAQKRILAFSMLKRSSYRLFHYLIHFIILKRSSHRLFSLFNRFSLTLQYSYPIKYLIAYGYYITYILPLFIIKLSKTCSKLVENLCYRVERVIRIRVFLTTSAFFPLHFLTYPLALPQGS